MKANQKNITEAANAYILSCVDSEGYDVAQPNTDKEKVNFVYENFKSEYGYNIQRMGEQKAFSEWLSGLPSSFNIDFENYRILELAKEFGSLPENPTDSQKDIVIYNWFNWITNKFFQLHRKLNKAK